MSPQFCRNPRWMDVHRVSCGGSVICIPVRHRAPCSDDCGQGVGQGEEVKGVMEKEEETFTLHIYISIHLSS